MPIAIIENALRLLFWKYICRVIICLPVGFVVALSSLSTFFPSRKKIIIMKEMKKCGLVNDIKTDFPSEALRNKAAEMLKMCYLSVINKENVERYIEAEGLENLDSVLERGNGAVALNPHFGPFLLIMPGLGHRGYRVNQVALQGEPWVGWRKGLEKKVYDLKYEAIEKNMPARFINASENVMAIRDVIRALRKNEIVLFASTGRAGKAWHVLEFLGRRSPFNLTPFRIAVNNSSPLLPVFVINRAPYAKLVIEKPIIPEDGGTPEELLERYVSILESYVRRYPEHFGYFLYEMKAYSGRDNHPFFDDYND